MSRGLNVKDMIVFLAVSGETTSETEEAEATFTTTGQQNDVMLLFEFTIVFL